MKKEIITIETGIPIPPPSRLHPRKQKYPLRIAIEALKQGESFVLRKKDLARAFGAAKNANIKIITRVVPDTNKLRVWLKPESGQP